MGKRLIIDGNAVYELDEECMLKKRLDVKEEKKERKDNQHQNKYEERGAE